MFQLRNHVAKITSVNPRGENHGSVVVTTYDISFETICPTSVLDDLHGELKGFMFRASEAPDLADAGTTDPLVPRFPQLGTLKWNYKSEDYSLSINWGIEVMDGEDRPYRLVLDGCKIKLISLTAQQTGGMVAVSFQLSAYVDTDDVGTLCELIKHEVNVTVAPPLESNMSLATTQEEVVTQKQENDDMTSGEAEVLTG